MARRTLEERFWADVEKGSDCWQWTGSTNSKGYGQFWKGRGVPRQAAHRYAYELLVGPIPDGLTLDHLCRNRACVNPEHLEPVTNRENILRGACPPALNAKTTHCKRGHEFTPENTRLVGPGWRSCRECERFRGRKHYYTHLLDGDSEGEG